MQTFKNSIITHEFLGDQKYAREYLSERGSEVGQAQKTLTQIQKTFPRVSAQKLHSIFIQILWHAENWGKKPSGAWTPDESEKKIWALLRKNFKGDDDLFEFQLTTLITLYELQ